MYATQGSRPALRCVYGAALYPLFAATSTKVCTTQGTPSTPRANFFDPNTPSTPMHDHQWDAGTPATPGAYQASPYDQVG